MIRLARFDDIKDINKIGFLFNENFLNVYDIKNYLNNPKYVIYVNEDKNINGLLIAYLNIDFIELEGIAVLESERRKGIANKMLNKLINCYQKDIFLEVATDNQKAINLYKKNGFQVINMRKKYYKDKDAYIMKRVV